MMDEALFGELPLDELERRVGGLDQDAVRTRLLAEYDELREYRSLAEWNRLVRACEVLALVGWGQRRPVEAYAEKWINGSMYTELRTATFESLPGTDRGWRRRGTTFVLDDGPDRTNLADSALTTVASQRNPLPKNPIRLVRDGSYPQSAHAFVEELGRLRGILDARLARWYGPGFGYLGIRLSFSLPDADPSSGLRMEYFHDESEVPPGFAGKAFVRPRLKMGRLATRKGEVKLEVTRHYTASANFAVM
ncbi:hypothetical protein [Micromonospora sp. LOL_023]|uniref:hypothetical protein n=1 Tax=Micromonospora sp. LOL_023 TaxID=3345418 RepID=UPI003A8B2BB4